MAMSYHMEARIKQDRLNRWAEQQRRTELEPQNQAVGDRLEDVGYKTKMDKVLTTDAEQFHQTRPPPLPMFRVNQDGYCNRYQNRQHLNPHVDEAFVTLYPGADNSDYNCDDNQVHRRLNSGLDKYQVSLAVNGEFHMQLSEPAESLEQ
ncbi:uncharacterized protein [Littorina saxatilis]|uniref:Uncharacterized protein n=1 Tax=Littorina saxatilis TaxID=31220 RepID=A0AAN9GKC2_9CAEN